MNLNFNESRWDEMRDEREKTAAPDIYQHSESWNSKFLSDNENKCVSYMGELRVANKNKPHHHSKVNGNESCGSLTLFMLFWIFSM